MLGLDAGSTAQYGVSRSGGIAPVRWAGGGNTGGHFSACAIGGLLPGALSAPNQIFSMRWGAENLKFIPLRISVQLLCTAFSSGISLDVAGTIARQFTTNASGAGSVTITNPTKSLPSQMNQSLFTVTTTSEMRVSGTAALTAGTQTLDSSPFAAGIAKFTAVQDSPTVELYQLVNGQYPIVIGTNEGIVIRLETLNLPASNTIKPYVTIAWVEVPGVLF